MNIECPILDIGAKKGDWGFINFIREHDFPATTAVVKGQDCIGRPFFAVKAEFVFADGSTLPTFSTFYQKYCNNKNIWQCFNYPNRELLKTFYGGEGYPMTSLQFALLDQLLTNGRVELTEEYITHAVSAPAHATLAVPATHVQLRTTTLLCD